MPLPLGFAEGDVIFWISEAFVAGPISLERGSRGIVKGPTNEMLDSSVFGSGIFIIFDIGLTLNCSAIYVQHAPPV